MKKMQGRFYHSEMRATTVKADCNLRRQEMRRAAKKYRALLRDNPAERRALAEWEAAPLATAPRGRRKWARALYGMTVGSAMDRPWRPGR